MDHAWEHLDEVAAEHGFSGVIRIDRSGRTELERAYGMADRAHRVPNMPQTQFAIASGCKGFTALTVMSLVEAGHVRLDATARSFLGADLPEVDPRVTLEHLLAHRSGVGDYVDEDEDGEITDYVLEVPVHALATTEGYLPALAGRATKFAPGERFSYCNSGFVILALIVERVTGRTFHDVVEELVCRPAGLTDTSYLRSDELPGRAARGYLAVDGLRTNVLHLPVRGSGDGGLYSTLADLHRFWDAVGSGRIVSEATLAQMLLPRSEVPTEQARYGLGFWLHESGSAVHLDGYDAGVSFRSVHDPSAKLTWTVISNSNAGGWPVVRHLTEQLTQ